jgi:transposase
MRRWRCRDKACSRRTFVEQFPEIAAPLARRTRRVAELIHLFGHGVGGRPSERLLKRIGMPTSDDTILRHLKRRTDGQRAKTSVRVVGVDDWAWRKGHDYGTIVVDLERREVVDVLPDRSTANISAWLAQRPEIEVVSRDRCGSYAQGAQDGAPQAHQVADRFHMLQNLREALQTQLSRAGSSVRPLLPTGDTRGGHDPAISCSTRDKHGGVEHRHIVRMANQSSRQAIFDRVHSLRSEGKTVAEIVRQAGFDRRTISKWIQSDVLPQRNASAPKTSSPLYFEDYLSRRWAEGCVRGRRLFNEIKTRGYSGSFSNLERLLAKWRRPKRGAQQAPVLPTMRPVDPAHGRPISPIVAAALCIKPRGLLTSSQAAKIDVLTRDWREFAAMRQLAMRFRGILRSKKVSKLGTWLKAADQSGLYAIQRFARTLRRDINAVRNAVTEPWSNGQTEGQINRLKTLKRAMYGRAGPELLRARMLPL